MIEHVSYDEAAEILGVVRSTVIRLVKAGRLSSRGRRRAQAAQAARQP